MRKYWPFVLIVFVFVVAGYTNYQALEALLLKRYVQATYEDIDEAIAQKQSATLALAIAAAKCANAQRNLATIAKELRSYTKYKNVWFKVMDHEGKFLFSTHPIRYYHHCKRYKKIDIHYASDIVIDCYGLHLGAFVPIDASHTLMTITHFNSIVKDLQRYGVHAVALLTPRWSGYAKALKPLPNGYKITSYADSTARRLLHGLAMPRLVRARDPFVLQGYVIGKYPLKARDGTLFGWIVFAKEKSALFSHYIGREFFVRVLVTLSLVLLVLALLYRYMHRQRERAIAQRADYFYRILNNINEIVLINDGVHMKYVNATFFRYFTQYHSLEEFTKEHACVCDFFVEEEGFIAPLIHGKRWTEYIVEHPEKSFYAKVRYEDREYIFQVRANRLDASDYVVIMVDVTNEYRRQEHLRRLAIIDPLTKLYNRYFFEKVAREKIEEAMLGDQELLFAMIDVDDFKRINDTYGHDVGDRVLQTIAQLIHSHFRSSDPAFRVGGEEFLIIFETKVADKILELLEKLRKDIAATRFEGVEWPVTVSIGVARFHPGDTMESLYKRADEALYVSKRGGKNTITYKE